MIALRFLCFVDKKDLELDEFAIESKIYSFIVPHEGRKYMTLVGEETIDRMLKKKNRLADLNQQEKELIEFSDLRTLKQKDNEYGKMQGINNFFSLPMHEVEDGVSVNSENKKKIKEGQLEKRYKSCQAFFFHIAMMLLSGYIGVMFIGWIHIKVQRSESTLNVQDNASIWSRLIGVGGALICLILKTIFSQIRSKRTQDYDF